MDLLVGNGPKQNHHHQDSQGNQRFPVFFQNLHGRLPAGDLIAVFVVFPDHRMALDEEQHHVSGHHQHDQRHRYVSIPDVESDPSPPEKKTGQKPGKSGA